MSSPLGRYRGGEGGDIRRQWRRRRGWRGVPREGPQGLLSGQGSTTLRGPDPSVCGRPCNPAGCVPAVQGVLRDGASDPVHRQSALTSCVRRRRVPTVQTVQKTVEIPQVLFVVDML